MPIGGSVIGSQPYSNDSVAGTVQQVSPQAGYIVGYKLVNTTAAVAYLQVFGVLAANVVLGTTPPLFFIRLQANESVDVLDGSAPIQVGSIGIPGQGISIAGTTTPNGSTPAAISVSMFYL